MFISDEKAMVLAQEVVDKYTTIILQELGVESDGIEDRITISDDITNIPNATIYKDEYGCNMVTPDSYYQLYRTGSARITIYAINILGYRNKYGELKTPWFLRLSKKLYKGQVLFGLAHELRHYWQFISSEYYKKELDAILGVNFIIPYELKWCEKDANEFADKIVRKYSKRL